ncbi:MAG: hypothetical protein WAV79_00255 [Anaerolineae bacterium]
MVGVGRRVGGGGSIHGVGVGVGVWIGDWNSETTGSTAPLSGVVCGGAISVSGSGVTPGDRPGPQPVNVISRPANSSGLNTIVNLACIPFMACPPQVTTILGGITNHNLV